MRDSTHQLLDIRQSINYAKYLQTQGWIVERIDNINYFIRKLPLIGSVLKIQRPREVNFEVIKTLEKKHRVFQTIIEPNLTSVINSFSDIYKLMIAQGFKLSKSTYLPSKTLHLDLTQPKEQIFNDFSKNCKYAIRKGESFKISKYSTPSDIKKFHNSWKKSVKFGRYVPSLESLISLKKSFPKNTCIFLASHNKTGSIIGGAIFTRSSHDIAYYWYGFTNKEGRTSLSQYSLLQHGILWGKKMGCKVFDFEGIYDERFPLKSWVGFTHFKKQFGGNEILYPGCYIKLRLPI